ncbi:hypothetical protein SBA7_610021 [Candidatus Sulfotelmatobacter sp. SbA7]|nr:hypothetical protein SBA7_610021 [Candidatus Sulfotelmatobacter sp. SbA7]
MPRASGNGGSTLVTYASYERKPPIRGLLTRVTWVTSSLLQAYGNPHQRAIVDFPGRVQSGCVHEKRVGFGGRV